jgi:hypothetical protein
MDVRGTEKGICFRGELKRELCEQQVQGWMAGISSKPGRAEQNKTSTARRSENRRKSITGNPRLT